MKKTHLLKLSIVLAASGFLVGCTNQKTTSVVNNSELADTNIEIPNNQTTPSEQTQPTNPTEPTPIIMKGKQMKNLADFAPIAASGVIIHTSKGDISVELFRDLAPLTTINFLTLAKEGFYNGIVFHRVIPGFMAQVGDPLTKDKNKQALWGTGGPGYAIADEFNPTLKHNKAGILSMANSGPNTGGSQVFITYAPQPHLDGIHAVFGQVTSGLDIAESLGVGDTIIGVDLIN